MERGRVVIITKSLSVGGAEHMVYGLVKNIDRDRYKPYVVCYGKKLGTYLEREMEKVCSVCYLDVEDRIRLFSLLRVMRSLSLIKPDIVHSHMGGTGFGALWSFLHSVPLVVTIHTRPDKAFSRKNEILLRLRLKAPGVKVIAVSKENSIKVREYFKLNEYKCTYVNNGIDINKYNRKPHEGFRFINAARQDENKNQGMIIRCFEKMHKAYPGARLTLAGDGPCHNQLMGLAYGLGLNSSVEFPGMTEHPEDYYSVSDVYVQSSHREALPLSVLEAMASWLPVISTNVGGLKDVVSNNGILVRDGDEEEMYQAMLSMVRMPECEIEKMQEASRQIVKGYSSEGMAEEYMGIYDELRKNSYDRRCRRGETREKSKK